MISIAETVQAKNVIQPAYNKIEIIILLQKILRDYAMIDEKIKDVLHADIIIGNNYNCASKFEESLKILNENVKVRNSIIEELLNLVQYQIKGNC